jgi:hypothetical protein
MAGVRGRAAVMRSISARRYMPPEVAVMPATAIRVAAV